MLEIKMKTVELYTDGACSGNPGPGGYGAILKYGDHTKEFSGGEADTTNNRMELMGVVVGLEALKEYCKVILYSDSKYVVDSINKGWAKNWQAHGWMTSNKTPAKNSDLWYKILTQMNFHQVKAIWIKGHAGHPENERCDKLAVAASKAASKLDS